MQFRSFGVRVDKSHGQRSKLTGVWTSKLPQEMVAAMSQGDGDGDIFEAMKQAARKAGDAKSAMKAGDHDQVKQEAQKETRRDHDR